MIILVLGTPGSGKSKKAEDMIIELSEGGPMIYLATMIPFGDEGRERVARHRKMREGKGFVTLEEPVDILSAADTLKDLKDGCILLECMSNLAGNILHDERFCELDDSSITDKIAGDVAALGSRCRHLVIVSNEFPDEAADYDEDTKRFVRITSEVNRELMKKCQKVYHLQGGEWIYSENN